MAKSSTQHDEPKPMPGPKPEPEPTEPAPEPPGEELNEAAQAELDRRRQR